MDMKRINAGKLRAIGYAPKERILRVEFDDGSAIDYAGAGERKSPAGAPNSIRKSQIRSTPCSTSPAQNKKTPHRLHGCGVNSAVD